MSDPFDFGARHRRYAVMGNPVSHSRSPRIHALFADQCGIRLEYTAIQVDPGGFVQAVQNFQASGGSGLNITVPFKEEAWRFASERTPRAELAEAVNTLRFEGADMLGDNTDGVGLRTDLTDNLGVAVAGADVLVLGAGGAVRGVIGPLLEAGPRSLVIANRTLDRAVALADRFARLGPIEAIGYERLEGCRFTLVINGTSAGLDGAVPPVPASVYRDLPLAYDMIYGNEPTAFCRAALVAGAARAVDGLGMLVEQAAESFLLWHGARPHTAPVINALRPVPGGDG